MRRITWIAAALLLAAMMIPAAGVRAQAYPDDDATAGSGDEEVRRAGLAGVFTPTTVGTVSSPDEGSASGMYSMQGRSASLSGPIDAEVYRVGPGDVMLLQMWGKLTRSVPIEVAPEGTDRLVVFFPLASFLLVVPLRLRHVLSMTV